MQSKVNVSGFCLSAQIAREHDSRFHAIRKIVWRRRCCRCHRRRDCCFVKWLHKMRSFDGAIKIDLIAICHCISIRALSYGFRVCYRCHRRSIRSERICLAHVVSIDFVEVRLLVDSFFKISFFVVVVACDSKWSTNLNYEYDNKSKSNGTSNGEKLFENEINCECMRLFMANTKRFDIRKYLTIIFAHMCANANIMRLHLCHACTPLDTFLTLFFFLLIFSVWNSFSDVFFIDYWTWARCKIFVIKWHTIKKWGREK